MLSSRPTLLLPFRNRDAFLEQYFEKGGVGGIFVAGDLDVDLGEALDVEVSFAEEGKRFHIKATVRWKRAAARRSILPGVGLEFLPSEARTHELLLTFARGGEAHHKDRETRRYGVSVQLRVITGDHSKPVLTDDLSEGGAFLLMDNPPPMGTNLEIKLRPPGTLFAVAVVGHVVWRSVSPGRKGVGVEFVFDSPRKKEKVARLVTLLKERIVRELKVLAPRMPSTPPTTVPPGPASTPPTRTPRS